MTKLLERHPRVFLSLLAILYLVPGIINLPLLDRDEPRFAQATIEMMEKKEWIVPYFNNDYRFDKPPLTYWWMRLNYSLFGKQEWTARLHSVLASWLTALILFQISKSFGFKTKQALFTACIWLSSFQVLIHSRVAVADMLLILCLTLSLWALLQLVRDEASQRKAFSKWFYLLYFSMAIGFLAKGPLAILIPVMSTLFSSFYLRKDPKSQSALKTIAKESILGFSLMLGIIALWGLPALALTKGAYFDVGLKKHVVQRGFESFNNRNYIPGLYYVFIILIFLSPWVSKLIPSLKSAWKEKSKSPSNLILLSWIFSTFLIFAFYKTQLPHYILPAYPAIALLIARFYESNTSSSFQISVWFNRIVFSALIGALAYTAWKLKGETFQDLKLATTLMAVLLLSLLVASECTKRNLKKSALFLVAITSMLFFPIASSIRNSHISVKTSEWIAENAPNVSNFFAAGFTEPSLVWYLNSPISFLEESSFLNFKPNESDCFIILCKQRTLSTIVDNNGYSDTNSLPSYNEKQAIKEQFKGHTIQWIEGYNLGNGSWVEVALITQ